MPYAVTCANTNVGLNLKMTKKRIAILTIFSAILILSNIYSGYINVFTEGLFKSYLFQTEKAEFEFWTMPSKGRDIEMMELQFKNFREENPEHSDLEIYRTFGRNPLKFWNWFDYLTNDRYDYKYQKKISQAFEQPIEIDKIESAFIEIGPNNNLTDSNDFNRSLPYEKIEQITNEMNIAKKVGLTKFLPKYKLTLILKDGSERKFRMTANSIKENDDITYEFRTENYADTIWKIGYKP
ncbi:MAG TPA: hypothetical protein VLA71_20115 [Algoriphagus sp.]|nr:hypothetical protein [Algoriphagus sp.]